MRNVIIGYSTYSEAAETLAAEKGLDYSGHDRVVTCLVDANIDAVHKFVTELKQRCDNDGEELKLRSIDVTSTYKDGILVTDRVLVAALAVVLSPPSDEDTGSLHLFA